MFNRAETEAMMAADDLVSVVMPNFNGARFIGHAVRSVLDQTYATLELLVCDDGSTDDSMKRLQALASEDKRVRILTNAEGKGPGAARNYATTMARGRYIAFLDSDDIWERDKLSLQLKLMQSEDSPLSYTALRKMDDHGDFISDTIVVPDRTNYRTLLKSNVIACSSAVYDVSKVGKRYMPFVDKSEDFPLWLGILKEGHEAVGCAEPLLRYRVHATSYSANKLRAAACYWQILRQFEHLSMARSAYYFAHYAVISGSKFLKKT